MNKQKRYNIIAEPDWMYEAASCVAEMQRNNDEELIENHARFGMTKEGMMEYLNNYQTYKKQVSKEMQEILEKYRHISPYLSPTEDSNSLISMMYYYININHLSDNPLVSQEDVDEAVVSFFIDAINDNLKEDIEETELHIDNVSDVIRLLGYTTMGDKDKMTMITLYSDRHKLIQELVQFLKEGAVICQKYADTITKDHASTVDVLKHRQEIDLVRLKLSLDLPTTMYVCIFPFNQIQVQQKHNKQIVFMGMYVPYLSSQKQAYRYQNDDVITALKALADATRWKILGLLAQRPMYLQEIANALELSPATVSHHINLLMTSAFINIIFNPDKSKKVFYETNQKGMQEIADVISTFALRSEDQPYERTI